MVTAVLGVALLLIVRVLNDASKSNRFRKVKFLSGAGAPAIGAGGQAGGGAPGGARAGGGSPSWLPMIKIWLLGLAGWCFCSEWFASHFLQWADFHWGPLPVLMVPIAGSAVWLIVDFVDRGGIKPLSFKLAFWLPVLMAATHGVLHDWVVYLPSQPDTAIVRLLDAWF